MATLFIFTFLTVGTRSSHKKLCNMKFKVCRVSPGLNTELEEPKTLSGLSSNLDDEKDI